MMTRLRPGFRARDAIRIVAASLGMACLAAVAYAQAPAVAKSESPQTLAPGVVYKHLSRSTPTGEPWSIHVLEVSRKEKQILVRAVKSQPNENGMQRELPTVMATRVGAKAVAVINGDYDMAGDFLGVSDGLTVTSGEISTTGKPIWPAMAIRKSGAPVIAVPKVEIEIRAGKRAWLIGALNKPFSPAHGEGSRVFTREYRSSLRLGPGFRAVIIKNLKPPLPLRANSEIQGEVAERPEIGNEFAVPAGSLVFVERATPLDTAVQNLPPGTRVRLRINVEMERRRDVRDVIGGFPILVRAGVRNIEGTPGANLKLRHPRTTVCYNDRSVIFTVVDGRQPQLSVGMTLEELADLQVELGCTMAMNTDGGGSSVMVITDPALRIVNSPSDGKERGRGNAWLIVRK